MNFFPVNGIGFEIKYLSSLDIWNEDIVSAAANWCESPCNIYDENDTLSNEIFSWHEVEPLWLGKLPEKKGGSISGVHGFDLSCDYIIFDPSEQDEEKWAIFLKVLADNNIPIIHGGWSQLA